MSLKSAAALGKKLHIRLLIYLLVTLIFAMPVRSALEHHFLYFPKTRQDSTPAAVRLPFEELAFTAREGVRRPVCCLGGFSESRENDVRALSVQAWQRSV